MRQNKSTILLAVWLGLLAGVLPVYGQQADSGTFIRSSHADPLFIQDGKMLQELYFESHNPGDVKVQLECWFYKNAADSVKVFSNKSYYKSKLGLNHYTVNLHQGDSYIQPSFGGVLRRTAMVPCGSYRLNILLEQDQQVYKASFTQVSDSAISLQSPLIKDINDMISPASGQLFQGVKAPAAAEKASNMLFRSRYRLERYFSKKGMVQQQSTQGDQEIIDLYADGWYMGRYELDGQVSISQQLKAQQDKLSSGLPDMGGHMLGDNQSLLSQFREMKKNSRDNSDMTGEIALSANFSNDQEPNSQQDNNYYEARGDVAFPLFDIPVNLSGYYTTQDQNRQAKSSYVHFRYDAEKAKEQLLKLLGAYNKKYEQTLSQGASFDMVYGQFIGELQTEKDKAIAGLKQQLNVPAIDMNSLGEAQLKAMAEKAVATGKDRLQDSLQNKAAGDSTVAGLAAKVEKAKMLQQQAEEKYAKAMEQYQRIMALEQKIEKYQSMLEQYRNTNYYDSLMAYGKIRELKNMEDASYKDIAKKATGLLPESKTKSMLTGLTSFDAGMFPKYVSDYTMSGQMMKGLDAGYDIGFAEIGGSYGKMEYIDREGNVEGYKAYSARVKMKPVAKQTLGLVYFGYSPGKKLLSDDGFFKDYSVSIPSFRSPAHVISAVYAGELSKYVRASGEYAVSDKQGQSKEAAAQTGLMDKSAYNFKVEGLIPYQNINLEAGYEHAGKAFENNTLPVLLAGTDRIRLAGSGDMFRSFLSLGVEYNYLLQNNLSSRGNNSKWGFTLATHSKRYPSVSLAYKPFSTFRSYDDTLNIEQKPILGEVWTGKVTYQIKKKDRAVRFTLLYNRNSSTMDTVRYGSTLLQFNTIYTLRANMVSLSVGSTTINTDLFTTAYPVFNNTKFANLAAGGSITENIQLNGGTDLALAGGAIGRYGCFVGGGYRFKKLPFMVRANFRYSNYRLDELVGWKQLYSGGIDLAWRFKVKVFGN